MRLSDELWEQARSLVSDRLGLDFPETRRWDLERGLLRACRTSPVHEPTAYVHWVTGLPTDDPEWRRLAGALTVGETYFFRDRACFESLEGEVLPSLIAARRAEEVPRLRLWSAGCASGEEAYSLAILLDRLLPDRADWALTILATDINVEALAAAQRGQYRAWALRDTPERVRDRYFQRKASEVFDLTPEIREMVTFSPLNLAEDGYPAAMTNTGAMDLVLCRNVLMYFTREAQRATVARLRQALLPGGWLVVSPAESSADLLNPLVPVTLPGAIFYRKEQPSAGYPLGGRQPSEVRALDVGILESVAHLPSPHSTGSGQAHSTGSGQAQPQSLGLSVPSPQPSAPIRQAQGRPIRQAQGRPIRQAQGRPSPHALLEQAREMADRGSLEEARRMCEDALVQDRLDPEVHLLLAAICQEQGDTPAALEALRRAIYLEPDSAPAHFLLGSLLLRQGEDRRWRRSMETVVSLLGSGPRDETVPGSDGLTAGRLLEMARAYLSTHQHRDPRDERDTE